MSLAPSSTDAGALHEAVVVPHDQLCLDLLDEVHRHPDHDEQRGSSEEKWNSQAIRNEIWQDSVKEWPNPGQSLHPESRDEEHRQETDYAEINRPCQREPR